MTRTYSERESLFSQQEVQRWSSLQGCDSMAQVASSSGRATAFPGIEPEEERIIFKHPRRREKPIPEAHDRHPISYH